MLLVLACCCCAAAAAAAAATSALACAPVQLVLPPPLPQGTSKVPLGGFATLQGVHGPQRFSIHKAFGPPDRLPTGACSEQRGGKGNEWSSKGEGQMGCALPTAILAPQSCSSTDAKVLVALLLVAPPTRASTTAGRCSQQALSMVAPLSMSLPSLSHFPPGPQPTPASTSWTWWSTRARSSSRSACSQPSPRARSALGALLLLPAAAAVVSWCLCCCLPLFRC